MARRWTVERTIAFALLVLVFSFVLIQVLQYVPLTSRPVFKRWGTGHWGNKWRTNFVVDSDRRTMLVDPDRNSAILWHGKDFRWEERPGGVSVSFGNMRHDLAIGDAIYLICGPEHCSDVSVGFLEKFAVPSGFVQAMVSRMETIEGAWEGDFCELLGEILEESPACCPSPALTPQ